MGQMTDAQQKVRELFDAHFTVSEIVERTSLEIQTVVRFINAPRMVKRRNGANEGPLSEVRSLGLAGD
jgi:DNA invertase Pin-like site-specific DNA recombinase